jgi:hypothetical protein
MAGVDFVHVFQVVLFMVTVWFSGRLFKALHQPAILEYLLAGIVMGPQFLDIVPYASNGDCDTMLNRRLASEDSFNASSLYNASDASGSMSDHGSAPECYQFPWVRWSDGHHTVR